MPADRPVRLTPIESALPDHQPCPSGHGFFECPATRALTDTAGGKRPIDRTMGTAKGDLVVPDDFDAPLSDEVLSEFER